ncbi:hypothetical protein O7632_09745 [Solwaraspora sp. WMMD406]|uniref:hypothetical protein n=1 Tax=Solwaraspora sp. WMMD406 TaxID=3016095 RepID=UPI002417459D|nr:hypothetical protein [Solwaraspora sp. WMMD406]MDG4764383.1 hypothetical protein [Solwaraspora sp. WMMD406]
MAGSSSATAAGENRRPICNSIGFNLPTTVGGTVTIPVTDVAADPDLNPVALVSVFGGAPLGTVVISDNSTPDISHDDVLIFTRTSSGQGSAHLYWTVSDGSLSAQCVASGYHLAPGNG